MADIPAKIVELTRNADGTCVLKFSVGGTGPTQMLVNVVKFTTAQCTTIATRMAQGAIGGAGSAGTDTIAIGATDAASMGVPGHFHHD